MSLAETYQVRLYLSGPIEIAKQVLRRECLREGLCITIEPTTYIYTGGEESGYVVGLLNYPRFPSTPDAISARADMIGKLLLAETSQHSYLLVTPEVTKWYSLRDSQAQREVGK